MEDVSKKSSLPKRNLFWYHNCYRSNSPDLSMSRQTISCSRFPKRIALVCLLPLLLVPSVVRSQDAVRPSLAGEAASEARRQDVDRIPYNLLVGPVRLRVGASVGVEYNDNINYADDGFAEEDVIIRPQINFDAIWPLTQLNTLRLDIGISYAAYLDHSEANTNQILVAPNSQLAFDIFVGDFRINFHDRFSVQQDPIAEVGLNNVTDYRTLPELCRRLGPVGSEPDFDHPGIRSLQLCFHDRSV